LSLLTPFNSEICDLADKYGALTMIDECHATGFLGESGRGTDEYRKVKGRINIINSTLGKALGGAAGSSECHINIIYIRLNNCQYSDPQGFDLITKFCLNDASLDLTNFTEQFYIIIKCEDH
jgi:hypothetical protein